MKISEVVMMTASSRVIDFLKMAPLDEVYSAKEISEALDIPESTIKSARSLKPYTLCYCGRTYYGRDEARFKMIESLN